MSVVRRVLMFPLVRLVLFAIAMGLVAVVFVIPLHAANRAGPVVIEHVMAIAVLASLFVVVRFIEQRPFFSTFFPLSGAKDLSAGFALGALLLSAVVGTLAASGHYVVTGTTSVRGLLVFLQAIWFFFVVAVVEEVLFRAVVFRLFEEMLGTWAALGVSALIFGLAHLGQPHSSWTAAIAIAIEAGVLLGAVYIQRRTLWLPIGVHWAWNLFEGPVYGTGVSGTVSDSPILVSRSLGSELWTGGEFGPEAGLVAILICTAAGVFFSVRAARAGLTMRPMWSRRPRAT